MAGRPPAFSYAQFKEAFAQSAAEGKEPTYEAVRARFEGKGSFGLIASYKTRLRGEQAALPETAKIPDDLADQIRTGLMTLHSTLRAEVESTLKVANEVQAEELLQIGLLQDRIDEDQRRELEWARATAQKALVQVEDRDVELARLRHELLEARGDVRRLDVACNVAVAERNDARANAAKLLVALDQERSTGASAANALAVSQERITAQLEQVAGLKAECSRLAALERDADEVAGLKALLQVTGEKVQLMAQMHAEQQDTIIALTTQNRVLQRERDEFMGRADEAQKMHLSSLGVLGVTGVTAG